MHIRAKQCAGARAASHRAGARRVRVATCVAFHATEPEGEVGSSPHVQSSVPFPLRGGQHTVRPSPVHYWNATSASFHDAERARRMRRSITSTTDLEDFLEPEPEVPRPMQRPMQAQASSSHSRAAGAAPSILIPSVSRAAVTVNMHILHTAGRMLRAASTAANSMADSFQRIGVEVASSSAGTIRRAQAEIRGRPAAATAVSELRAQVNALTARNAELAEHVGQLEARAERAESLAGLLQGRLEAGRAQRAVDGALQLFRRHVVSAPADLDTGTFFESEEALIGSGGCGRVYAWHAAGREWVVKADKLHYKYSYSGAFEPERCADLLPAFLPPHPCISAPITWWVGTSATATEAAQPAASQLTRSSSSAAPGAGSFQLYSLYERYDCSLRELVDRRASAGMQLSGEETLVVVRDVAGALAHLATHNVVHADVKPENVMLQLDSEGRVRRALLIDFGLARLLAPGVERADARGGTWLFKAPEQLSGPCVLKVECDVEAPAARRAPYVCRSTDVWALGTLICYIARGGALTSQAGFPIGIDESLVAKWGDRHTKDRRGYEPFYQTWDGLLPPVPDQESGTAPEAAALQALLRDMALGCMAPEPARRMAAGTVHAMAEMRLAAMQLARNA